MEFKIKQSVLKEELGFIQGVVERKTTIPVLSNILIESIGENEIRIVGTDLDCTIRCDAEAEIITPGAICLQARKLFDIARALADDKFGTREREARLLGRDRKRRIADKIAKRLGRQFQRRALKLRYLGKLLAIDTGEAKISAAGFERHPLVVLFFEMHIAWIERPCNVKQLACL